MTAMQLRSAEGGSTHSRPGLRPVFLLTALLVGLVVGSAAIGRAGMLQYLFPAAAAAVAFLIYRVRPVAYVGLAWWMWLLSPAVRRIADYQSSWNPVNPISVTPLVVGLVLLPSMIRHLPKFGQRRLLPFLLIAIAVFYGYAVGIFRAGLPSATYAMLTWLVPLMLGAHLVIHWQLYREHRDVIGKTYIWGLIFTGAYGVMQFIDPLPWDRFWMKNVEMVSIGAPEPFKVRVFSTVNAPGPYGYVAAGHLLVLLGYRSKWRVLAFAIGTAGLLLSLVRSAWIGLVCGVMTYAAYTWHRPVRGLARGFGTLVAVLLVAGILAPLLPMDPIRDRLSMRFATFSDPSSDHSLQARTQFAIEYARQIQGDFLGAGLGSTKRIVEEDQSRLTIDNGVLETFFTLGWPGGVLFFTGLILFILPLMRSRDSEKPDAFMAAARAGGIGMLVQSAFGNVFVNNTGAALYTAFGILAAARLWTESEAPDVAAEPVATTQPGWAQSAGTLQVTQRGAAG